MYKLKKIFKNEKGQGMVEYGLILALVSIVAILGLSTLGGNIKGQFEGITDSMESFEHGKYSDEEIDDLIKNHYFFPVATADELNNVRSATVETYGAGTKWEGKYTGGFDKKYIQVADIDLSGIGNFEPIGKLSSQFTGIYDGGGYVISNLKIDRESENYVGLFGRATGATFKNVGLEDVHVTGRSWTGGLVGYQSGSSTVSNSYTTGSVAGTGAETGGLVGHQSDSSISDSYATGSVTGGDKTGGLVGEQYFSSVSNSYATGSVTGGDSTGGLVGVQGSSSVTNSYATGNVTGGNFTGGLVGSHGNSSTTNSYATGTVTGTKWVGGLVGSQWAYSTVTNSYWDKDTTKQEASKGGTGKTTEEMKNKDTYTDWDNTIWEFKDGQYPTLR